MQQKKPLEGQLFHHFLFLFFEFYQRIGWYQGQGCCFQKKEIQKERRWGKKRKSEGRKTLQEYKCLNYQ